MKIGRKMLAASIGLAGCALAFPALADGGACAGLPSWGQLQSALTGAVGASGNGGLGFNMWATLVANDGTVCAVAFSGGRYTDQWLGSRVISAQKANTANDFSLSKGAPPATSLFPNGLALSTANLYPRCSPAAASMVCSTATRSIRPSLTKGMRSSLAPRVTRWSASGSAGSTCSAAGSPYTNPAAENRRRRGQRRSVLHRSLCRMACPQQSETRLSGRHRGGARGRCHAPRQHHLRHYGQSEWRHRYQRQRVRPSDLRQHRQPRNPAGGAMKSGKR